MIVHTFGPAWDSIDISPFVVKLCTWLRMAGLPYESRIGDLRKSPTAKLPAVTLDDGRVMSDSQQIIDHLSLAGNDPLGDARLTPRQCAQVRALQALLEADVYFAMLWRRWAPDEGFAVLAPAMAAYLRQIGVPGLVAPWLAGRVRQKVVAQTKAQGIGRRPPAEIDALAVSGLQALATFLADKPFILGEQPCSFDATVFGFLHTLLSAPFDAAPRRYALAQANLVACHARMRARYWSEPAPSAA